MTTVQIPVSLGGTNVPYNDGTGPYGMGGSSGYGYAQYFFPMLSEVMAACALAVEAAGGTDALLIANNLSDLEDAEQARLNLGLGTAAVLASTAIALKADNLSGLADAAAARSNLELGTAAELDSDVILLKADNLSGLADPAAARGNLELGTAAVLAAAAVLLKADNLSGLADAATARGNLGLGTAALLASTAIALKADNLSGLADAATARGNLGLGTAALLASTAIALKADNLSGLADAAAARTNLGLGPIATMGAVYTVATLPNPAVAGARAMVWASDLGTGGTLLVSNGVRWKPASGQLVLKALGAPVAGIDTTETIVLQALIPTGPYPILQAGDTLRVKFSAFKSGSTSTATWSLRIGTAGTTSDALVNFVSPGQSFMVAANRTAGMEFPLKVLSTTSVQRAGNGLNNTSAYGAAGAGTPPSAVTIPDTSSNSLYVSFGLLATGSAGDTLTVQEADLTMVFA